VRSRDSLGSYGSISILNPTDWLTVLRLISRIKGDVPLPMYTNSSFT